MADETTAKPEPKPAKARGPQKQGKGRKRGKRYKALAVKIDRAKAYTPAEAVKLVKETSQAKFDTSVDLHLRMGVDPRHAEQMVRGSAVLPNGTGKTVRVAVFAQGDKAREAQAAGADTVGADDLAKRIEGGWLDFDVAIATPDMMGAVGKLGKVLGPRGLMPNPKSGTVTFDLAKAVKDAKGGRIEFRPRREAGAHHLDDEEGVLRKDSVESNAQLRGRGLRGSFLGCDRHREPRPQEPADGCGDNEWAPSHRSMSESVR